MLSDIRASIDSAIVSGVATDFNGTVDSRLLLAKSNLESTVPLKSVATPETIAESILALISLNKNATGQLLILDGGHHLNL